MPKPQDPPPTPPRRPPPADTLAVAAGGALGALLRYAFVLAFPAHAGAFPKVTFYENLAGAFVLAFVLTALLERWPQLGRLRAALCTGVLGSFTTFSTFSLELLALGSSGGRQTASLYAVLSVTGGLCAAASGLWLARRYVVGRR